LQLLRFGSYNGNVNLCLGLANDFGSFSRRQRAYGSITSKQKGFYHRVSNEQQRARRQPNPKKMCAFITVILALGNCALAEIIIANEAVTIINCCSANET